MCQLQQFHRTKPLRWLILSYRSKCPLETWDEYSGKQPIVSSLQPAMGKMTKASHLGDVLLGAGFENDPPAQHYKEWLVSRLAEDHGIANEAQWVGTLQRGGQFEVVIKKARSSKKLKPQKLADVLGKKTEPPQSGLVFYGNAIDQIF